MTYNRSTSGNFALPLPITQSALRAANQFAEQQPTPQKAAQVRLNTLAVCVTNDYLQMLGIPTALSQGDSWNPVTRLCADTADLEIVGVGRLECRPLLSDPSSMATGNQSCSIPPEVWQDRVGYVVVQIDRSLQEANLLGFVTTAAVEVLSLEELQAPEALLDHLDYLLHPVTAPQASNNLSQWLQDLFETGWQTVESLLTPPTLAYGFRSGQTANSSEVRRAKLLDLGSDQSVILVVELATDSQGSNVRLQVHPSEGQLYLPSNLQMTVVDETGAVFLQAQSRSVDNYIQLQLSGTPGERFSVAIALGTVQVTESFVI